MVGNWFFVHERESRSGKKETVKIRLVSTTEEGAIAEARILWPGDRTRVETHNPRVVREIPLERE